MRLKAFEYIVLLHPKKEDGKETGTTELICERKFILAKDEQMAAMKATREIDAKYDNDLDRCEIVVRPF